MSLRTDNNSPTATIFALVPGQQKRGGRQQEEPKDKWVRLGALWQTRDTSNLVGSIDAIPIAWSIMTEGRVCIVFSDNQGSSR